LELFHHTGTWLRCALHAHTTNSDGEATPEGLCNHYARAGFDVLAITDHWHVTDHEHPTLVVIPSSELSARVEGGVGEAEVLALGVPVLPEVRDYFPTLEDCAAWVAGRGGVPYLCHPYWSGLTADHYASAPSLVGLEIFNAGSELANGNGLSTVHWDDVLHRGLRAFGIATDDCHYPGSDSRFAWTSVRVDEPSREAVLAALREGRFYASAGPEILGVEVWDGGVEVRCSPARAVAVRSGPWDGCRVNADPRALDWRGSVLARDDHGAIVAARFEPPEYWRWGRVEVEAADGARAWSNPFPVAEGEAREHAGP
jgi:hypothetical protein